MKIPSLTRGRQLKIERSYLSLRLELRELTIQLIGLGLGVLSVTVSTRQSSRPIFAVKADHICGDDRLTAFAALCKAL